MFAVSHLSGFNRRRSQGGGGGFTPTQFDGCVLWVRPESFGLSDGDPVITWEDESGEGNDLSQGNGTFRPTYETAEINGYSCVRFDGSDDRLSGAIKPSSSTATPEHFFIVIKPISAGGFGGFAYLVEASDFGNICRYDFNPEFLGIRSEDVMGNYSINGVPSSDASAVWKVLSTSRRSDVNSWQSLGLGSATNERYGVCDIAEVIVYMETLTEGEVEEVEGYLLEKYGI